MKVQIRRSILTYLYEVQVQEDGKSVWETRASYTTREAAELHAADLRDKARKAAKPKKATKKNNKKK